MTYLHNFLKEALRLTPPLPALIPRLCIKDHMIGDILIKKNTLVIIFI
jgi:cytochrome P450